MIVVSFGLRMVWPATFRALCRYTSEVVRWMCQVVYSAYLLFVFDSCSLPSVRTWRLPVANGRFSLTRGSKLLFQNAGVLKNTLDGVLLFLIVPTCIIVVSRLLTQFCLIRNRFKTVFSQPVLWSFGNPCCATFCFEK